MFESPADSQYAVADQQRGQLLDMLEELQEFSSSTPQVASAPVEARTKTKLPRLELPTFSRSLTDWTKFKDLFQSPVLNDPTWTDVEKFNYLSASLSEEAAQLIERVPINHANFKSAWDLLQHQYENHRRLVHAQYSCLYAIKPVTSHTAGELKRLLNQTCSAIAVLKGLDAQVDDGSYWITYHTLLRLDKKTIKSWESLLGSRTDLPTLSELVSFLENFVRTLEACETYDRQTSSTVNHSRPNRIKSHQTMVQRKSRSRCPLCTGDHILCFCKAFRNKALTERKKLVTEKKLCFNCLGNHDVTSCQSIKRCQRCVEKHHTMLHEVARSTAAPSGATTLHTSTRSRPLTDQPMAALLATALVSVCTSGRTQTVRALIDPCSEVSLVTESVVQNLRLPRIPCTQTVLGAGAKPTANTRGKVKLTLSSLISATTTIRVDALILPRLTAYRPRCTKVPAAWASLNGLQLADPGFTSSAPIDLLLGIDVFPQIIRSGIRGGGTLSPVAQETVFGWIISGPAPMLAEFSPSTVSSHTCSVEDNLTELIGRFWIQEEVPIPQTQMTKEEAHCEEHFSRTHFRRSSGRYVVRFPFKCPEFHLGASHSTARRILGSLERRFELNDKLAYEYRKFMTEYQVLGHMTLVPNSYEIPASTHYYLPHHGVLKTTETGTKLRVVFNGSKATSNGQSLNNLLCVGPKLQQNLMDVLIRWKHHKWAFIADIEKMYRQIEIHEDDRDFQRVLWREMSSTAIKSYQLTTVTYGLSCAPYLALRTLQQLARDEELQYPRRAHTLRQCTYVDAILTGGYTMEEAKQTQSEVIRICKAGGFTLKKWCSNTPAFLHDISTEFKSEALSIPWHPDLGCSALRLKWHPLRDELAFAVQVSDHNATITKRYILSQVAKLFDPLGWLAPVLITAKLHLQSLWRYNYEWDTELPCSIADEWTKIAGNLPKLSCIRIPRWINTGASTSTYHLHLFADASEKAYAASVYIVTVDQEGRSASHLIAAKTKAAPLKTISLPRLELCAVTLAFRLLVHLRKEIQLTIKSTHLWTDSTIVLAWLQGEPWQWTTYVANRVSEIQTTIPDVQLHHVKSEHNAAVCASRGITA